MIMVTTPLIPNVHAIGTPIAMVMPITIIKVASIISVPFSLLQHHMGAVL
jgi:hypothetical protein